MGIIPMTQVGAQRQIFFLALKSPYKPRKHSVQPTSIKIMTCLEICAAGKT